MKKVGMVKGSGRVSQNALHSLIILSQLLRRSIIFVLENARALQSKKKVFDITTYGEKTTYLARDYPERSRGMLKRFSYDVLTNSELAIVNSWLTKTNLAELFTN